jgi:glycosyltransferase involved in cell wall biosynthesis
MEKQIARDSPTVSVIIPCWNGECFVGDAIKSALAQTYPKVEVIVIDDGSTDGSLDVIKSFGDLILWETGPNRGGGAARNRGIELARGEFVQFLDADDILYPGRLSIMVPIALSVDRSVLPVSDWDYSSEDAGVGVRRSLPSTARDAVAFCLRHQIPIASPIHRRDRLRRVGGFNTNLPCGQERDLHLRLVSHGLRLERVAKPLYLVRRRARSVSSDYVRVLDQHEGIFLGIRDLLEARRELTPMRREAIARALAQDARHYQRRGLSDKAERYFRLAKQVDRGGGLSAFGRWYSRALAYCIGPARTERLIQALARISISAL